MLHFIFLSFVPSVPRDMILINIYRNILFLTEKNRNEQYTITV